MDTPKQNIVILGAGESGVGAALLAKSQGFDVFVSDRGSIAPARQEELRAADIPFEEGKHTESLIFKAAEVVKSPGIPDHVPLIIALIDRGIPVISEIEFAARYTEAKLIGITGSNGKTTTTKLLSCLLEEAGFDIATVGNVGLSFARSLLTLPPKPIYVVELSSFQLDNIDQFRPFISMILNITPDHLDRYEYQMEKYIASKFRIIRNQAENDWFLYLDSDQNIQGQLAKTKTDVQPIAITESDIDSAHNKLTVDSHSFDLSNSALIGRHNQLNALFAIKVARLLGAAPNRIQSGLEKFKPVPHRLEKVAEIAGATYFNDSKATNVEATFFALEAMQQPVVWIVGGQDKGNDYQMLKPLVTQKVKAMVCLGVDNQKILAAFAACDIPKVEVKSAKEAVEQAAIFAQEGDAILLSPACASFDLFKNYEARGALFKEAVFQLMSQKIDNQHELSS